MSVLASGSLVGCFIGARFGRQAATASTAALVAVVGPAAIVQLLT